MENQVNISDTLNENNLSLSTHTLGTDKDFLHSYIEEIYQPIFDVLRAPMSILEIGIQHKASLALWKILFGKANVMGWDIDISQPCHPKAQQMIDRNELTLVEVDAYSDQSQVPQNLSIIIDDGPHTLTSQLEVLKLRTNLEENGVLIIEDIGEVGGPQYCFFKLLTSLPVRERKFCLNIDLSGLKGRWDDAVFVYSKNEAVLESLRFRHRNNIHSYRQLLAYSVIWKLKTVVRGQISR